MNSKNLNRRHLVTGASGYVGGRLVGDLLADGFKVRVLVRDRRKISDQVWASQVEVMESNANNKADLVQALEGIHTAYYLLHSINAGVQFDDIEAEMAQNFADASAECKISQIVYLGDIANDENRSKYLTSRINTGTILASGPVPVLEMRAGIIIGSGSASFEMLRHLIHRLPVMTTPKWVLNRTQPIGVRDVLYYLRKCAELETPVDKIFEIGGTQVLSYADMMPKFAALTRTAEHSVDTRWSDAAYPTAPWQEAQFEPRGLGGQLYWYLIAPLHTFVFRTMIRNIVKVARKESLPSA
jgi:uncharacterized protein YbjT (DUF2867 family)